MVAEPEERDYLSDFWKFVDANLPEPPYNRPKEVKRIHDLMANTDFDLYAGWLEETAYLHMLYVVQVRSDQQRAKAKAQKYIDYWAKVKRGEAVESPFQQVYTTDREGTVKRLGQMNKADCLFVAAHREKMGTTLIHEADLMRDIASRLQDDQCVEDVLVEADWPPLVEKHSLVR